MNSLLDTVSLRGDLDEHFSISNLQTNVPGFGNLCIDCSTPMRWLLPSLVSDGMIYQGQMTSTCRMRNLAGDLIGKADVDFDFGIAPWLLSADNTPVLIGDLTYLYARWALTSDLVATGVSAKLQRNLNDVSQNQAINQRYLMIMNEMIKSNLNEISNQILPNGLWLPLPEWTTFSNS